MEKLNLDDIKKIQLSILIDINNFCKKNRINYSITGGTLIGAIRHKGFIPWDDDIDIAMTRDNYDRFCKEYRGQKYQLITNKINNYGYMFAKVCDPSTAVVEKHAKRVEELGVYVDIFPIDYLDNDYKHSLNKVKSINFLKYLLVAWNWKHFYLNKNKKWFRQIPRFFFFLLSRFVSKDSLVKRINKKLKKNHLENGDYSACYFGSYGSKEINKSYIFSEYIEVEFEGYHVMCFKHYDSFLTNIYGDYMALPPVEKRITHHTYDAYYR